MASEKVLRMRAMLEQLSIDIAQLEKEIDELKQGPPLAYSTFQEFYWLLNPFKCSACGAFKWGMHHTRCPKKRSK